MHKGDNYMKLTIKWENPILSDIDILEIQESDLDDFYVNAPDVDKANLFFVFLATAQYYLDGGKNEEAAHLNYLIAHYLFTALTPPASDVLAKYYIKQAITLNPRPQYLEEAAFIENGN